MGLDKRLALNAFFDLEGSWFCQKPYAHQIIVLPDQPTQRLRAFCVIGEDKPFWQVFIGNFQLGTGL